MAKTVDSESSCTSYEERWVNLFFTDGKVCCKYCLLLQTYSRPYCLKTGEMIVNENVPGYWCPLLKADEKGQIVNPNTGEILQT